MTKIDFDDYARSFEALTSSQTRLFDADRSYFDRYRVELMRRVSGPKTGAVLDFGCGVGLSTPHLRTAFPGSRIVGCDPSQESLALAREQMPDIEFMPPEDIAPEPQFNLMLASSVFHHIAPAARVETLRYCIDRLNRGGHMFIFEHNPYNPVTRHLVNTCPFDEDAILLTRRETTSLLRAAGFEIAAAAYCLFFPQILAALRPLEPSLGWLPLGGQYFVAGIRP